ncbi:molybdopterin biosynthesis protein [Bacillus sp. ISL-40]|uniref:molybdopterin biosynthesis protein n=1 Tax=unclassified Bacillus (in: firmicutes) TaxID=185979 RepID=UPI001BE97650|nr:MULTISPECIES: molybdopterin biosynthesis protein [unclassified Bacillus (in: firmicutes)]MBT2696942.1 molybdopterin biosynthesis protein [Bacillus sp. ISL-40]MBT2719774.1 molybdopterin biosynthesis protein [Bacillus sp. ISL-46]MBT2742454.1 molybdopterin biosynthesis protein [Bacillus sp. ISL-77]
MNYKNFKRKIYLEDKPRAQAREEILAAHVLTPEKEEISTINALGRVTAEPIFARVSMPHYHASAMDGIAVMAENTYTAHEQNPLRLKRGEEFCYVDTGNAIPSPFNAVIMIEHVDCLDEETIEIIEPATPWQHIRPIGEDVVQEEMLFPQGHIIRPADLGVLLAGQQTVIPVAKKPVVTIIPTGNELVEANAELAPGQIIEFNGSVFAGFIKDWGGEPNLLPIVKDEPEKIKEVLLEAAETSDIIVINAGSSAGSKDYTVHIIGEIGEVFTHGVAARPGKPVILGKINGKIVVGVPGYPVSAYLALEWFVRPLICKYLQIPEPKRQTVTVKLGRRIVSSMGAEDFVRMNIGYVNGQFVANPLTRAAGVAMSYVRADGLLIVPANIIGYEQGDLAEVELMRPLEEIKQAIVFCGSHDLTIDLLSSRLKQVRTDMKIVSSHVGSMAGIMAIRKGEAHVAGIHLLDPSTKEYNISYINKLLAGQDVVLYPFLKRKQGWILPKGNPLGIESAADLARVNANYVNRQKGAGTRILFDLLLEEGCLTPEDITGYDREMFSHLAVAAEVNGDAHGAGLGIYPAAKAMDLDFVPVADEEYDLLMTRGFYESESGKLLMAIIQSNAFKEQVEKIGGYQVVENAELKCLGVEV